MIVRLPLVAALAVSLLLPVLARAETVVAICRTGGCDCALSPLSQDEIALVVGLPDDPAASTLVYEPALEALSWVTAPRRDIQASFGGTGDCPVDPAAAHQALTPRDGTWRWRTLAETTAGCPAELGGMLAASGVAFTPVRLAWDGAFHPDLLAALLPQPDMAGLPPYAWHAVGPDRWLSDNVQSTDCRDGACMDIALHLTMTLVAPDRISGLLSLRSTIDAPQAAIRAGFGLAECRVRLRYDIIRTGP
jgi:hypothetical protein